MNGPITTSVMLALRWHGRRDVRLEEVPVPTPERDEALIRVMWVGLCGSDLEEYLDGPVVIHGPVTLGHEIVGTVAAAAADGSGPAVGTPVVVDVVNGCGRCFWCQRHEEGQCPNLRVIGQHVDGGLAQFLRARASRLIPVPPGLDPTHAAMAEPMAVAVRAVRKLGPLLGRGVAVLGGGTIGLLAAQLLRQGGAAPVVVLEPDPWRQTVARRLGLEVAWAAADRAELLAPRFPPQGVDVVLECSGAAGAAGEAARLARPGGAVLLLGVTARPEQIDVTDIVLGEKTIQGSAAHMWDDDVVPAVAQLASRAVDVEPLLTHRLPLQEGVSAFELLADPASHVMKVLIDLRERDEP